jgi:hypothetical protein
MATRRTSRTTFIVGAAILAGAAIATPFTVRAVHHPGRSGPGAAGPTSSTTATTLPPGALRGDVDGDGRADVVSLDRHDMLRVQLGSGSTVRQLLQDGPRLEGLADVGSNGLAIATASGSHARTWTVWTLRGDHLAPLATHGPLRLGDQPGFATTWVSGRTVFTGTLDPLQEGATHVVVAARSWTVRHGKLATARAGLRCWDRSSPQPPARCRSGQDWAYDVGPHADLPALLPAGDSGSTSTAAVRFPSGERWQVRPLEADSDPETGRWVLRYAGQDGRGSVEVPAGWAPTLFQSPVRVGDLTDGVLLSQEGGDSDTWRIYVRWAGRIQQLATQGPLPLGGGFTPDGGTAYLTWRSKDGDLYTRVGTARPGRDHVYAWQPTGGTADSSPVLQAVDRGIVCIDDFLGTYGTCAS